MIDVTTHKTLPTTAVILVAWGLAHGCRYERTDTTHCNYNEGNSYCAEKYPDGSRPFCESGLPGCVSRQRTFGCTAERPIDECYSPCGDISTIDEDASCLGPDASSGSSGSGSGSSDGESSGSGETATTTGPQSCTEHDDCMDAGAPICDAATGECVPCDPATDGDAACAEADAGAPVCLGGACVQCTAAVPDACMEQTPVCDEETNTCMPCTEHGQCGEAACNLFTGACLPADAVVRVGLGQDFSSIGAAVNSFAEGEAGTIVVLQANYDEAVTVDGGRVLAFVANDGDLPVWALVGGGAPQLTVTDGTVLVDGIQISSNASSMVPGVRVDAGRAWLDRSRVVDNNGGGIVAQNAGELVLRNCFVGGSVNNEASVIVTSSTATFLYTTIAAGFGSATALSCDGEATAVVRNSLLVAETDSSEIACARATIDHSAAETDLGGTNTSLGNMSTAWFVDFAGGDLHLSATPPIAIATTAEWVDGDPPVDIDNQPRPQLNGAPDVAGADVR